MEINGIVKELGKFKEELSKITENANSSGDEKSAGQRFKRWKLRLVDFISKNISEEESANSSDLSYSMVMQTRPLQNFNSRTEAYLAYMAVLIEELKSNPEGIVNNIESIEVTEEGPAQKEKIKIFISYNTLDKEVAGNISKKLEKWGLDVFLAHDDIEVSEEWREVILENLFDCDVIIPIITENFRNSDWTSQEIGVVLGRKTKCLIMPIKKGNNIPYGFISNFQAGDINNERFELSIIKKIENKYPKSLTDGLLDFLYKSPSFRESEFRLQFVLDCVGSPIDRDILNKILDVSLKNKRSQILYAKECKEWLLGQLKKNKDIDENIYKQFKSLPEYKEEL